MAYKLELLLSSVFMMAVLLLSGDLINIHIIKSSLDALGTTVGYRISREGMISEGTLQLVELNGASFALADGQKTSFAIGDTVIYRVSRDYYPFIIKKETMHLGVWRSAVVGYYKD